MKTLSTGPVQEFSHELKEQMISALDKALKMHSGPKIAAFDADGTLWDLDMGETFFEYQIHNCGLSLPKDPWQHYLDLKKPDTRVAYAWLAQINAGKKLSQVRQWAQQMLETLPHVPIFSSQKWLIEQLKQRQFEIYVVTASIKWSVEPGAQLYGIPFDHVLGVETEVDSSGTITEKTVQPVTWRQGKAEALLKATKGAAPLLCAGNTMGDFALLQASSAIRLALRTQNIDNGLAKDEDALQKEANALGWFSHKFRDGRTP